MKKILYSPPLTGIILFQAQASCLNIASPGDPGAAGAIIIATDPYELP